MNEYNFKLRAWLSLVFLYLISISVSAKGVNIPDYTSSTAQIEIISHRGANRLAPENTYASARKAIEYGSDYVEIDVRRSKDGVYYNFHDPNLERTTNGSGILSDVNSTVIDTLDAGEWFSHKYKDERVPRLFDYLKWIKGKAKVYFDMKDVRLEEFMPEVYKLGMEKDCFFWFSDWKLAFRFRELYPDLNLKVNAYSVAAIDSLVKIYKPQIVETSLELLSDEFIYSCHKHGLKIMAGTSGNDFEAYRIAIEKKVDMINLDNPDVFSDMVKNGGVFKSYKLIAHRGGIVEDRYNEYDPESITAAIKQGYYMLEVDVRETKDGVLILNHDDTFSRYYNDTRQVKDLTWDEIKKMVPVHGNYHPISFEELAKTCSGKIDLMIDVKGDPTDEFYLKMEEILLKHKLLSGAYFIDNNARKYFWGRAKFSIRTDDVSLIKTELGKGNDVACNFFLFDAGTRLNSSIIKMCQAAYITVVPSVNIGHYKYENPYRGAERDIEFLKKCGVTEFQIDSDYDEWLPVPK